MKRLFSSTAFAVILLLALPLQARAAELLIPVGKIIGLQLRDNTVTVAAFDDLLGSSARDAGLQIGDEILSIDEHTVDCAEDVKQVLKTCRGDVSLTVLRSGKTHTLHFAPAETAEGKKLGVYLRQGIAGIGTVTFYDPASGTFGALGHGVSTPKGNLLEMTQGSAYTARIQSVVRGKSGEPGQLKGNAQAADLCGQLLRNTPQGVFGTTSTGWPGEVLPVADFADIRSGPATILSTVEGDTVREYSVEILKIYPEERPDNRNFLLKVTDPTLLEATGGIVQGMGVSYNRDNTGTLKACKG